MKDFYNGIDKENKNAYIDLETMDIAAMEKGIYETPKDGFRLDKVKKSIKHPLLRNITLSEMKRGIIFSEILGKPKGYY